MYKVLTVDVKGNQLEVPVNEVSGGVFEYSVDNQVYTISTNSPETIFTLVDGVVE